MTCLECGAEIPDTPDRVWCDACVNRFARALTNKAIAYGMAMKELPTRPARRPRRRRGVGFVSKRDRNVLFMLRHPER